MAEALINHRHHRVFSNERAPGARPPRERGAVLAIIHHRAVAANLPDFKLSHDHVGHRRFYNRLPDLFFVPFSLHVSSSGCLKYRSGFTRFPSGLISSKCRCDPVVKPEPPTLPITSSTPTRAPS